MWLSHNEILAYKSLILAGLYVLYFGNLIYKTKNVFSLNSFKK